MEATAAKEANQVVRRMANLEVRRVANLEVRRVVNLEEVRRTARVEAVKVLASQRKVARTNAVYVRE